jgi:cytoskeletal protein CcmA (bactofilin family)
MRATDIREPRTIAVARAHGDLAARILLSALVCALLLALLPAELPAQSAGAPGKAVRKAVKEAVQGAVAEQDTVRSHDIKIGTSGLITISQEECYTIPEGEVRKLDLYTWARCIDIRGTLDGDIIAGFQSGEISGTVTQDLNGASNSMTITGEVGDDVRFACETFHVIGRIGGDLLVAAKDVQIHEGASVDGDVLIACGTATINGTIGGRARIVTGALDMNGTIGGNAEITTDGGIRLGPNAHIGGDLSYEGPSKIEFPEGTVAGNITWHHKTKEEFEPQFKWPAGASAFFHILGFVMALVAGSVIVALTKDHARRTAETIRTKPLKSLGIGFVTFICMPVVLLILLVLIITAPLMFVATLAYLILLYIAKFYVAIWLGNLILKRSGRADVSPIPSMLLGLVLVYLVTAIPYLGTFVGIVIIFFGIGALLQRRETRLDSAFEPSPVPVNSNGLPNNFPGDRTGE